MANNNKEKSPLKQSFGQTADILRYNDIKEAQRNPDLLSRGVGAFGSVLSQVDQDRLNKKGTGDDHSEFLETTDGKRVSRSLVESDRFRFTVGKDGKVTDNQAKFEKSDISRTHDASLDKYFNSQDSLDNLGKGFIIDENGNPVPIDPRTGTPISRKPVEFNIGKSDYSAVDMYGHKDIDEVDTVTPKESPLTRKEAFENPALYKYYRDAPGYMNDQEVYKNSRSESPRNRRSTPLLRMTSPITQQDFLDYGQIQEAQIGENEDIITKSALEGYNSQIRKHNYKRRVWGEQQKQLTEDFGKLHVDPSGVNSFDQSITTTSTDLKKEWADLVSQGRSGRLSPSDVALKKQEILGQVGMMKATRDNLAGLLATYVDDQDNISLSTDPRAVDMLNTLSNGGGGLKLEKVDGVLHLVGDTVGITDEKEELKHKLDKGLISKEVYNKELANIKPVSIPASDIASGRGMFKYNVKVPVQKEILGIAQGLAKIKTDLEVNGGLERGSLSFDQVRGSAEEQINTLLADDSVVRSVAAERLGIDYDDYEKMFSDGVDRNGDPIINTNKAKEYVANELIEDVEELFTPYGEAKQILKDPRKTNTRTKTTSSLAGLGTKTQQVKFQNKQHVWSGVLNTINQGQTNGVFADADATGKSVVQQIQNLRLPGVKNVKYSTPGVFSNDRPELSFEVGGTKRTYDLRDPEQIRLLQNDVFSPTEQQYLSGQQSNQNQQQSNQNQQQPTNVLSNAQKLLQRRGSGAGQNLNQNQNQAVGNNVDNSNTKSASVQGFNVSRPSILNPSDPNLNQPQQREARSKFKKEYGINFNDYEKINSLDESQLNQIKSLHDEYNKAGETLDSFGKESKVGKEASKRKIDLKGQLDDIIDFDGDFLTKDQGFGVLEAYNKAGDIAPFGDLGAENAEKESIKASKKALSNYKKSRGYSLGVAYDKKIEKIVAAQGIEWTEEIPSPGEASKADIEKFIDDAYSKIK